MVVSSKSTYLFELQAELTIFLNGTSLFTWKNNRNTNYGYSDLNIWQTFSPTWTKWACHFKKNNSQYLLPMTKLKLSSKNWNFGKHVPTTVSVTASQCLKTRWMRWVFRIIHVILLMIYKALYQHLDDLYNSVSQFSKCLMHYIPNHTRVKEPFKVQSRTTVLV